MVGLMQIMIYLLCIYLFYTAVEIFQIGFVSSKENKNVRLFGIIIAILAIGGAVVVGIGATYLTDDLV
jgi:hypothetical protein